MVWWTGQGDVHISYIPRKPTPLGIELKTACCGDTSIMVNIDMVEGRRVDGQKAYMDKVEYPSTATMLRLAEPWKCSGRGNNRLLVWLVPHSRMVMGRIRPVRNNVREKWP